jgi:hypothetical protein
MGIYMLESDFTQNVHKKLDPRIVKAWKIKDDYQGGIYDAAYFAEVNKNRANVLPPVFVEYKLIKSLPKRETSRIIPALSELQKKWLERGELAGLPVYVIVGLSEPGKVAKGAIFKNTAEWLEGISKQEFVNRLLGYSDLADFITSHFIGD